MYIFWKNTSESVIFRDCRISRTVDPTIHSQNMPMLIPDQRALQFHQQDMTYYQQENSTRQLLSVSIAPSFLPITGSLQKHKIREPSKRSICIKKKKKKTTVSNCFHNVLIQLMTLFLHRREAKIAAMKMQKWMINYKG